MDSREWNIEQIKTLIEACKKCDTKLEYYDLAAEEASNKINLFIDDLEDIVLTYGE